MADFYICNEELLYCCIISVRNFSWPFSTQSDITSDSSGILDYNGILLVKVLEKNKRKWISLSKHIANKNKSNYNIQKVSWNKTWVEKKIKALVLLLKYSYLQGSSTFQTYAFTSSIALALLDLQLEFLSCKSCDPQLKDSWHTTSLEYIPRIRFCVLAAQPDTIWHGNLLKWRVRFYFPSRLQIGNSSSMSHVTIGIIFGAEYFVRAFFASIWLAFLFVMCRYVQLVKITYLWRSNPCTTKFIKVKHLLEHILHFG